MSDFASENKLVDAWLVALPDEEAPCGPDLEYDNDFLALTQAAAGKPESQFGAAESPNWRDVAEMSEALLDRSRDLRIAISWLRAKLHLVGYGAMVPGLKLLNGLMTQHWDHVHPLPDPDDDDPYARINALAVLCDNEGLIGDLRETFLIRDRAIGELKLRGVSIALGLTQAGEGDASMGRDQIASMLVDFIEKSPEFASHCAETSAQAKALMALVTDKLGQQAAPDLRPLVSLADGVVKLLPQVADDEGDEPTESDAGAGAGRSRGLSGQINSREEAIRAIDMICAYIERAEPTNPAPLFMRRARQLIGQNFLQLLKALAPQALSEVASMVGVDPETVEGPDDSSE